MVLFWRDVWVPQQTRWIWVCPGEACLCQMLTDNLLRVRIITGQVCTKVHYACQKQCHVYLDSHLTKPCL